MMKFVYTWFEGQIDDKYTEDLNLRKNAMVGDTARGKEKSYKRVYESKSSIMLNKCDGWADERKLGKKCRKRHSNSVRRLVVIALYHRPNRNPNAIQITANILLYTYNFLYNCKTQMRISQVDFCVAFIFAFFCLVIAQFHWILRSQKHSHHNFSYGTFSL